MGDGSGRLLIPLTFNTIKKRQILENRQVYNNFISLFCGTMY